MRLLVTQKNILFDLIEKSGMSPALFDIHEWTGKTGSFGTSIVYKGSVYEFKISTARSGYKSIRQIPGRGSYENISTFILWQEIEGIFENWLKDLIIEVHAIDKWKRFKEEIKDLRVSIDEDTKEFTASEYEVLKSQMKQLKQRVNLIALEPQKLKILEEKIDYLTNIAIDLKKTDWKNLFIGTIVSLIIQLTVSKEDGAAIWEAIRSVFSQFFLP